MCILNFNMEFLELRNDKTKLSILLTIILAFIICSCGEGSVDIGPNTYEAKIVIEGFLYPGQKVEKIIITRNIPLNTEVDPNYLVLKSSDVKLVDLQSGKEYNLTFNSQKNSFEYTGNDLLIGYDKSYQLSVTANVDGKIITAKSTTHTPKSGFKIINEFTTSQPISYRELNSNGNLKNFTIAFTPSPGTDFYVISIVSLNASDTSFIYNNAFVDVKAEDVKKELDRYKYQLRWLQNINSFGQFIKYDLDWIYLWFYGDYRVIVYACDENFRLYTQTYKNVQEFDGNFHEPRLNIQGDGIGIFGSAIADTVFLKVKK